MVHSGTAVMRAFYCLTTSFGAQRTQRSAARADLRGINGTVALDAEGRVHAVWADDVIGSNPDGIGGFVISNRLTYGVLTGTSWTELELGPGMHPRLLLGPDGVSRVIHGISKQNARGRKAPTAQNLGAVKCADSLGVYARSPCPA